MGDTVKNSVSFQINSSVINTIGVNFQAVFQRAYKNKELGYRGPDLFFYLSLFCKRALLLKESENNKVRLMCHRQIPGNQLQQQCLFSEIKRVIIFTVKFWQIYVNSYVLP